MNFIRAVLSASLGVLPAAPAEPVLPAARRLSLYY